MHPTVRLAVIVLAGTLAGISAQAFAGSRDAQGERPMTTDGDTLVVTAAARARGLRFDAAVDPGDRAWMRAAIRQARPGAARLIAEVDGLVQVGTVAAGGSTLGVTSGGAGRFRIDFNVARLDSDRMIDRNTVVLHELGHVIDFALVPARLGAELDAQIPRSGPCGQVVNCDLAEERFADTFAKWALHGAISEVGAGYGIALPASIETWGEPLAALALTLPSR
jgi:hypothetical protein